MSAITTKKDEILNKMDSILSNTSLEDLNQNDIEALTKSILAEQLKGQLKDKIKVKNHDTDTLQDRWLNKYNSNATKESYGIGLRFYVDWCEERNINIYQVSSIQAEDYLIYLKDKYSNDNTIRERIAALSSFYGYLDKHDLINKNHFRGLSGIQKLYETKNADEIPTDDDMDTIERGLWFELTEVTGKGSGAVKRQARLLLAVFYFIKYNGLRIGAFENLAIDSKGYYHTNSKGRQISGKVNGEVIKLLKKLDFDLTEPFPGLKSKSIQKSCERFCRRLYLGGELHTIFSLHDLRHYAAVKHYEAHRDIIATQRFLNHKNVTVTQGYLASLQCDV